MNIHPYQVRIERALELEGGLYMFEDVLTNLQSGLMQSFSEGDSFIVTRITPYPRKTVLEIVLMVGTAEEILACEPRIVEFAKLQGCSAMLGYGRLGWESFMTDGWRKVFSFYLKELPQ
jgi:hypothetical protein